MTCGKMTISLSESPENDQPPGNFQRIDVFPNIKDGKAIQRTQLSQFFICLLCFSIRQVYLFIYFIKLICNLLRFSMWLLLQERSQLQESPSKKWEKNKIRIKTNECQSELLVSRKSTVLLRVPYEFYIPRSLFSANNIMGDFLKIGQQCNNFTKDLKT